MEGSPQRQVSAAEAAAIEAEEARQAKQASRRAVAERILAQRSAEAARARVAAVSSARARAAMTAKALSDRQQMERDFQAAMLALEREASAMRAARGKASRARCDEPSCANQTADASPPRAADERRQQDGDGRHGRNGGHATSSATSNARGGEAHESSPYDRRSRREHETERSASESKAADAARRAFAARRAQERRADERAEARFRAFEQAAAQRQQAQFGRRASLPRQVAAGYAHLKRGGEAAMLPADALDALTTEELALHALRHQGCAHRCLGLAPNAPAAAVRKRFLMLARRLHPDKTEHSAASKAFAAIEAAFRDMQQSLA